MSQIRKTSLAIVMLMFLSVLFLAGCGDTNPQSNLEPESGKHPAGWLPDGHKTAANAHPETCTECHGSDFEGGISKIACTQCHLGNQESVHPLQWGHFAYALHGSFVKLNNPALPNDTSRCSNALCHGTNLDGVGGTGPSCTSCHIGGTLSKHPIEWNNNFVLHGSYVGQNGTASCRNAACHGANLQGVFLSGPSCNACHNF